MTQLKVCRVRDSLAARRLVALGVDFLGFHALGALELEDHDLWLYQCNRELVHEHRFVGGVLLTKSLNIDAIAGAVAAGSFKYVQVHARADPASLSLLRQQISASGTQLIAVADPKHMTTQRIREVGEAVDYLLFDSLEGGTGQVQPLAGVEDLVGGNFVAGGITARNAPNLLSRVDPLALDVQTGTELPDGTKDLRQVRELLRVCWARGKRSGSRLPFISYAPYGLHDEALIRVAPHVESLHLDLFSDDADALNSLELIARSYPSHLMEIHVFHPGLMAAALQLVDTHPNSFDAVVLQVDSPTLHHDPAAFDKCIYSIRDRHLALGIALNAISTREGLSSLTLSLVMEADFVNCMLPPADTPMDPTGPTAVARLVRAERPDIAIGVDRGVDLRRVLRLRHLQLGRIVSGSYLANAQNPRASARAMRQAFLGRSTD